MIAYHNDPALRRRVLAQMARHVRRAACVLTLATGLSSVNDVLARIETLFTGTDDASRITCSSVHKAKGLERARAFLLLNTFRPERNIEEANLWYVAVTRAKTSLLLVESAAT